jgi:protein-S-isoprenylcysteine O-methyltransferase Ste14
MGSEAATVGGAVAPPSLVRRRDLSYWTDLLVGRTLPACLFSVFIVYKLLEVAQAVVDLQASPPRISAFAFAANQLLGLWYFVMIVVLYVIRLPKRSGRIAVRRVVVSFFGSFSIIAVSFLPGVPLRAGFTLAADCLALLGLAYSVWSLTYLGRSFSIMPEARRLVTGGPYRLSRHPLYFGEAVAGIGVTLPTVGAPGILLIGLFLAAQYLRIRWEEQVLRGEFPNYADYAERVPRYVPFPKAALVGAVRGLASHGRRP